MAFSDMYMKIELSSVAYNWGNGQGSSWTPHAIFGDDQEYWTRGHNQVARKKNVFFICEFKDSISIDRSRIFTAEPNNELCKYRGSSDLANDRDRIRMFWCSLSSGFATILYSVTER